MVVEQGWASLKQQRDGNTDDDALYNELVELNNVAKANHLGIYNKDEATKKASIRNVDWTIDANQYFENLLGESKVITASNPIVIEGVIEHVRDGASFRCYIPKDSCYVTFAFAGATCPRVNLPSTSSNGAEATNESGAGPEPFALQAKLFTEIRLLNRRLDLVSRRFCFGNIPMTFLYYC